MRSIDGDGLAVHQRRADAARHRHAGLVEPLLQTRRVFHADRHAGEQAFEDARWREVVGRPDLLQVDHHRGGRLGAVDDVAAREPLGVAEDVLPDPCRRHVGQHLFVLGEFVERLAGGGAVEQREVRVHHALGVAGGARGEEHRRHVVRARLRELGVVEAGVRGVVGASGVDQAVQRCEARLIVVAQAARVVVPDAHELRALRAQFEQLVDLLLVFDDAEAHLGVVDRKDELAGHRVLVQRHRNRAQRLRGQHRCIQPRPVLADHHHMLAALQAGFGQAAGQLAHQRAELRPGDRLPNAVALFAQRRRVGPLLRVGPHQSRKGGLHGRALP